MTLGAPGATPSDIIKQTAQVVLWWTYAAPLLGAAPFFFFPPFWIAALSLPRR